MGWVIKRPMLIAIEVAWRWLFGIPLLFVCWCQSQQILAAHPLESSGFNSLDRRRSRSTSVHRSCIETSVQVSYFSRATTKSGTQSRARSLRIGNGGQNLGGFMFGVAVGDAHRIFNRAVARQNLLTDFMIGSACARISPTFRNEEQNLHARSNPICG